eukprot:TRINITY_DN58313_c0_g1_i11.p1 TRINITY_DN58313_c0_g1~~TRINITY_DN58313_c0_g1_i11.p1  ORF type:complete len:146 (+),score=32.45 TRINITY_DN58313_c0_g1_i11:57-494(+)
MLREYGKDTSVIGQNVLSGAVIAPISLYDPDMLQPTVTKSLEKLSKIQPILETVFLHEVDDEGSDEPALGNFGNPSVSITGLDKLVEQSIIRVCRAAVSCILWVNMSVVGPAQLISKSGSPSQSKFFWLVGAQSFQDLLTSWRKN